jgi:agmatine/peptidylarginine deiminase
MEKRRAVMPAEWEPQSGVMLTWPHAETDWAPYLEEINETYLQMAEAIVRRERLLVVTPHAEEIAAMLRERLGERLMQKVRIVQLPTNDTWARDHGFITLRCADGSPLLLDFRFNGWGEKFDARLDNAINKGLAEWLSDERRALSDKCTDKGQTPLNAQHSTLNYKSIDFVLEGGSIESDGAGTIFTTTSCLMAPHRNQPLTKEQIDERLREMLYADRITWLDHGQLTGDDTDGHIDTIVRPCARDTILYIRCDNPDDEHYEDFKALEEQLQGLRTAEDEPYKLLPLPFPDPIFYDGERLPATYANFLIVNGAVLVPTYGQPANDKKALETLQKAFPDREMVPIDSTVITRQHGSIHCCTMQFPAEMEF